VGIGCFLGAVCVDVIPNRAAAKWITNKPAATAGLLIWVRPTRLDPMFAE
jgi:hypothetical protein